MHIISYHIYVTINTFIRAWHNIHLVDPHELPPLVAHDVQELRGRHGAAPQQRERLEVATGNNGEPWGTMGNPGESWGTIVIKNHG